MSSPQPPSTETPYPHQADDSIRESESRVQRTPDMPGKSSQFISTQPPSGAHLISQSTDETPSAICATHALLQSACRRKRLSYSGSKQQLAQRLEIIGVKPAQEVRSLAVKFGQRRPDVAQASRQKQKAPNWTKKKAARLCHVVADPRHATAVGRLYNKMETRAEIDIAKHDPWSAEFVDLFNENDYKPNIPEGHNGVTDALLFSFDSTLHPYARSGSFLKGRWNKLRSEYIVARQKFSKSGQGENDVFENITDGDGSIAYMHCVFYRMPALEAIVRALPEGCGFEGGLEEISNARSTSFEVSRRNKKRKTSAQNSIAESLSEVAKAVTAPVEININEKKDGGGASKFHEFDMSNTIAGTVTKLMTLKDNIRSDLRQAILDSDEEYIEELRPRIANVQRRIERALME